MMPISTHQTYFKDRHTTQKIDSLCVLKPGKPVPCCAAEGLGDSSLLSLPAAAPSPWSRASLPLRSLLRPSVTSPLRLFTETAYNRGFRVPRFHSQKGDEWGPQALRLRSTSQGECSASIGTPGVQAGAGEPAGHRGWEEEQQDAEGLWMPPLPSPSLCPGQRETDTHCTGTSNNQELRRLHKMTNDLHGREDFRTEDFSLIYRICMEERDTKESHYSRSKKHLNWGAFYCMRKSFW